MDGNSGRTQSFGLQTETFRLVSDVNGVSRMEKKNGTVLVAPLPPADIEEVRRAEVRRREELERLAKPREDVVTHLRVERRDAYPVSDVLDAITEKVLCSRPGIAADTVRTTELWKETWNCHAKIMLAQFALNRIEATKIAGGVRVRVDDGWPINGLAELSINYSGYESFARAVGVGFEGQQKEGIRQDLRENLIQVIGGLYLLAAQGKDKGQVRGIVSNVQRKIENITKHAITDATIRKYIGEAKKRGFKLADAGLDDEGSLDGQSDSVAD
ncbi:hypothetical protein N5B55_05940 [Ralstonia pickettii]|uniref:hypothetical protein n=1 Tax=Ralstonia pickettii TaxID=329 RepID=UPI00271472F6|nr:hypothetical protein [Ralstonia pickettii]WKZ86488.1 hypothetical protein N5B55_05940 [Ralstonia pickettii]